MNRRLILLSTVVFLVGWRLYREQCPACTRWSLGLLFSFDTPVDGGTYTSPAGQQVTVTFHDFGAAQSGKYYTWILAHHWLTGKCVVAQGYSDNSVREGSAPLPLRWNADGSLTATFFKSKYTNETVDVTVRP